LGWVLIIKDKKHGALPQGALHLARILACIVIWLALVVFKLFLFLLLVATFFFGVLSGATV
jgi:hypothetical protein